MIRAAVYAVCFALVTVPSYGTRVPLVLAPLEPAR